jgi:drug/metabolite transporter (DMT)-like permease
MANSAQENGIGVTSVTVKMSLAIPVMMAVILYQESIYFMKITGVVGALVGVFLLTYQKAAAKASSTKAKAIALVVLFLGSGLLDTLLNYVEKKLLTDLTPALFSAVGFGVAGVIGLVVLTIKVLLKQEKLAFKNVLAGIGLGIPNYFSIYFLIMAIRYTPTDDSITYALNNVGIVVASFLVGVIVFKETLSKRKLIGGLVAIVSLFLLTYF